VLKFWIRQASHIAPAMPSQEAFPCKTMTHQIDDDQFHERLSEEELRSPQKRAALNARDLARINRAVDELSAEAEDVLSYQAPF